MAWPDGAIADSVDPPEAPVNKGTVVYYNDLIMFNCTTREWDESVEYDKSGTDVIGIRYKLRFVGYIHAQGTSVVGAGRAARTYFMDDGLEGSSAPANYAAVNAKFWEARKRLTVQVNDQTILRVEPPTASNLTSSNRDIDNGPKPRGLNIVQVVNDQVFKCEWAIECMKSLCNETNQIPDVLNNRWSVSEQMDADFFTTRVIRGNMRLSSSNYKPGHRHKYLTVPGLEAGFKRQSIEYAVSESGLEVEYQVTDRQVFYSPPWPATSCTGSYTASTNDGVSFVSACHVRLTGGPASPRKFLIARALQVCDLRLNFQLKQSQNKCLLESASITESLGEDNTVDVSFAIKEVPGDLGVYLTHLRNEVLGNPLTLPALGGNAYNPQISPTPKLYGYDPLATDRSPGFLALLDCFLQSPCWQSDAHNIGSGQTNNDFIPNQNLNQTTITRQPPGSLLNPANNSNWSPAHKSMGMYTFSRGESKYHIKPCRAHLPIAHTVEYSGQPTQDTSVFIDLAPGLACRELTVDAERIGLPPQIPEPADSYTDGSIRARLLEHYIIPLPSALSADGVTRVFRVRAYYRWGLNRLPTNYDILRVGALPFTNQDAAVHNRFSGNAQYNPVLG